MTSKGSILVVDDDPIQLEVVRERLERAGWEVAVRDDEQGALQWVAQNHTAIVLLDVGMPTSGGDSLAVVLHRRGLSRNVGVILHSGMESEALEAIRRSTGALGAIQKTGDERLFLAQFDTLVETFRATRR